MTDNEIIKALGCCAKAKLNQDCLNLKCPFSTEYGCNIDAEDLRNEAFDLINRQKAEIERLKKFLNMSRKVSLARRDRNLEVGELNLKLTKELKTAKAEAIKEFLAKAKVYAYYIDYPKEHRVIDEDDLDNLLKEMVGE